MSRFLTAFVVIITLVAFTSPAPAQYTAETPQAKKGAPAPVKAPAKKAGPGKSDPAGIAVSDPGAEGSKPTKKSK